jgi:hypothetical protein
MVCITEILNKTLNLVKISIEFLNSYLNELVFYCVIKMLCLFSGYKFIIDYFQIIHSNNKIQLPLKITSINLNEIYFLELNLYIV